MTISQLPVVVAWGSACMMMNSKNSVRKGGVGRDVGHESMVGTSPIVQKPRPSSLNPQPWKLVPEVVCYVLRWCLNLTQCRCEMFLEEIASLLEA